MGEIKTPGMKNIENRHAAAGGGHTHTPATASPMGQQDTVMGTHAKDKGASSRSPPALLLVPCIPCARHDAPRQPALLRGRRNSEATGLESPHC